MNSFLSFRILSFLASPVSPLKPHRFLLFLDIVLVGKFGIQTYPWSIDFSGSVSFSAK